MSTETYFKIFYNVQEEYYIVQELYLFWFYFTNTHPLNIDLVLTSCVSRATVHNYEVVISVEQFWVHTK